MATADDVKAISDKLDAVIADVTAVAADVTDLQAQIKALTGQASPDLSGLLAKANSIDAGLQAIVAPKPATARKKKR